MRAMSTAAFMILLLVGIAGCEAFTDDGYMRIHDEPGDIGESVEVHRDFGGAYYYHNGVKVYVKESPGGEAPDRPHEYDAARN